jgi:hypothetical protein
MWRAIWTISLLANSPPCACDPIEMVRAECPTPTRLFQRLH